MNGMPSGLIREGFALLAAVGGPVLGAFLIIGVLVGVLQAATQINDPAVSFLPRMVGGGVVILMLGGWIVERLAQYWQLALEKMAGGL